MEERNNISNRSEDQWRELFRLKLANQQEPDRFRQAFYQMLAAQDSAAFRALESEIRPLKSELLDKDLYSQLESFLRLGDWQQADWETAWLFYWVMVKHDYPNWFDLCQQFPDEIFKTIDTLWATHSQGRFGFSSQRHIWLNSGGLLSDGSDGLENFDFCDSPQEANAWSKFCHHVEWCISEKWISENSNLRSLEFVEWALRSFNDSSESSTEDESESVWWMAYENLLALAQSQKELASGAFPALYANGYGSFSFNSGIGGGSWGMRKELKALLSHQSLLGFKNA